MIELIIKFIAAIVATEAITELVVKSEFFEPLRKWLFESELKTLNFIHRIVDCGYCFSVWAALFNILILFILDYRIMDFVILTVVVHRLSNMLHFIIDRLNANKG